MVWSVQYVNVVSGLHEFLQLVLALAGLLGCVVQSLRALVGAAAGGARADACCTETLLSDLRATLVTPAGPEDRGQT